MVINRLLGGLLLNRSHLKGQCGREDRYRYRYSVLEFGCITLITLITLMDIAHVIFTLFDIPDKPDKT